MRSVSNQPANFRTGLNYFADTPNILHLRYVLVCYPNVPMKILYDEIMDNFDKLITDASECAYFMANFPDCSGDISRQLCDGPTFIRLIACDPANLLLIARQRPSVAAELLVHFRACFSSIVVSDDITSEIYRLDLQAWPAKSRLRFFERLSSGQLSLVSYLTNDCQRIMRGL